MRRVRRGCSNTPPGPVRSAQSSGPARVNGTNTILLRSSWAFRLTMKSKKMTRMGILRAQIFEKKCVSNINIKSALLAGLVPNLRQIASNGKRQRKQWNGPSGVWSQIKPQINRLGVRGQSLLGSSTIFQSSSFSSIDSALSVLEQQIRHHRVSLVETNRVIPKFA